MTVDRTPKRGRPSLARKADGLVRREQLFPAGARALVMISGGQDSVALTHLLTTQLSAKGWPSALRALHVNYHLRGAESEADQALVENTCERLDVQLTVVHMPVDKHAGNVQEVARDIRRAEAIRVALETGCDRIVLGHTADDQAETLLYRMGRYGGLAALAGMRPNDPPWVRPLLECRREETAGYCALRGLRFARDTGNEYPGYARTGIRESVVPAWEAALPGAVAAAGRTAEVAAEVKELADLLVAEAAAAAGVESPGLGRPSPPPRARMTGPV